MNPHFKYNIDHANLGDNALSTAAYQHRTQLIDKSEADPDKRFKSSNTHKEDIIRERILIPKNNPQELYERAEKAQTDKAENDKLIEELLNELNKKHANRYTSHGILAHQPELTDEQNYEAVELFAKRTALDYNCLFFYGTHKEKNENKNIHSHYMISLFPLVKGKFMPKTERMYVDENGKILNKVDQPVLKRGRLQYNKDGSKKTKPGWKKLDLDENGNIQYNEKGHVKLKDIRVPIRDENGNIKLFKNGKRKKPDYVHIKPKKTELEKKGTAKRTRMLWQDCINEVARKYNVKDANGKLFQVDFRSLAEQDADKPISQKRIPRKKIGPYKNKAAIEYNSWAERIEKNEKINEEIPFEDLQQIYEIRREAIILENRLAEIQEQKKISYKAKKAFTNLSEKASGLFNKFTKKLTEEKESKNKKATYDNQLEFLERQNNVEYYLSNLNVLKYKAEDMAKQANKIIENDNAWGFYTKEKYYEISDTSKAYKELLIIKMLKKLSKEQKNIEFIDGLRSKEFEALALKLNLKKDLKNYKTWLTASQEYYSHLSDAEKKRQLRYSSKTFTINTAAIPDKSYSSSLPSYNNTVPNKSDSKSILPDSKTPNVKIKWKEKDYKKENEMEAAERRLSENWDPGKNLEVLPPDQKKDQDQKHEF